jgi:hypothetical protein
LASLTQKILWRVFVARVFSDMLKGEGFGAHGERHGGRLRRQIESGLRGLARRYVTEDRPALKVVEKEVRPLQKINPELRVAPDDGARRSGPRGRGRPRFEGVRPWEAEGVSRRTWERRRKKGGG